MKKVILLLSCVVIISCSRQGLIEPSAFEIGITAESEATRTALNNLTLSWVSGDAVGVMVDGIQGNTQFSKSGDKTFKGTFQITGIKKDNVGYYAYYPYSSTVSGTVVSATLANNQTAPFDSKNDTMVADVLNLPYNESSMPAIAFSFGNHMNAIVKINITNSKEEYAEEKVSKVVLQSAGSTMAGAYTFDVSEGAGCSPLFSGTKYDNVTVKYPSTASQPSLTVGCNIVMYAIVKSGDYNDLKLTIYSTNYSGGRTAKSSVNFERGKVTGLPAIDFGALMTDATATIDDLSGYDYPESNFWK